MLTASYMQVKQVKSNLKRKLEGMVHCFTFDLPCLLERKAVTCYGLLCMAWLCLWEGSCHMSGFASLCSWEREAVTRYGLPSFV